MADISGEEELLKQVTKILLTRTEKAQIVDAGAKILAENLAENTPVNLENKDGKHLKDMVTYEKNQFEDGSTNVGFTKEGYYAKFVEEGHRTVDGRSYHITRNGTKRMKKVSQFEGGTKRTKAYHFMANSIIQSKQTIKKAELDKAREILKRKGL